MYYLNIQINKTMSRKRNKFICFKQTALALTLFYLPHIICIGEATLLHASATSVKQRFVPYKPHYNIGYINGDYRFKQKDPELVKGLKGEEVFQIEPSDAIDITKFSQPDFLDPSINSFPGVKVPSMTLFKARIPTQFSKPLNFNDQVPISGELKKQIASKPMRDLRFIESGVEKSSLGGEYKFGDERVNDHQSDMAFSAESSNLRSQDKNNFTDAEANLLPVSSDAILSYKIPSVKTDNVKDTASFKISTVNVLDVPSHHLEKPIPSYSGSPVSSSISSTLPIFSTETAIVFNTHQHTGILNQTDTFEIADSTVIIPSIHDETNVSSNIPSLDSEKEKLSSGIVAGIVIAVLVSVTILSSAVIYLLYRKYNGKCTSVVEGKFNSDNCGYLDDSLRSSIYLNNHIELPKESSEEMSSLDNDSFLNSLETMTIQNYWADNSKNTKV